MLDGTLGTIYEDVEALTQRVTLLENQVSTLQGQLVDTGWIDLPLSNSVQSYSDDLKPKYRKIGNEVFLTGVIKGITAANTVLATLPEGFRPIRQNYFVAGSSTLSTGEASFFNCQINADGNVRITAHSSGTYNANYYLRLSDSFIIG